MKRQSFTQISETFVVCFVEYFDRNIFDTTGGIEDMARIYMIVCKTVWNIYTWMDWVGIRMGSLCGAIV